MSKPARWTLALAAALVAFAGGFLAISNIYGPYVLKHAGPGDSMIGLAIFETSMLAGFASAFLACSLVYPVGGPKMLPESVARGTGKRAIIANAIVLGFLLLVRGDDFPWSGVAILALVFFPVVNLTWVRRGLA